MLSDSTMMSDLRTLSKLQLNQKLCTSGAHFTVQDSSGVINGLWRSWYREDRTGNVGRVQVLFSLAMLRCEVVLLKGAQHADTSDTSDTFVVRLVDTMRDALPGIGRLAQTYRDDVAIVSSLTVLSENVCAFIRSTEESLRARKRDAAVHTTGAIKEAAR